jgi:hypothetical protein
MIEVNGLYRIYFTLEAVSRQDTFFPPAVHARSILSLFRFHPDHHLRLSQVEEVAEDRIGDDSDDEESANAKDQDYVEQDGDEGSANEEDLEYVDQAEDSEGSADEKEETDDDYQAEEEESEDDVETKGKRKIRRSARSPIKKRSLTSRRFQRDSAAMEMDEEEQTGNEDEIGITDGPQAAKASGCKHGHEQGRDQNVATTVTLEIDASRVRHRQTPFACQSTHVAHWFQGEYGVDREVGNRDTYNVRCSSIRAVGVRATPQYIPLAAVRLSCALL